MISGGMIIGIGNDLVDIRRIEENIHRYGQQFLNKIFTEAEQKLASSRTEENHVQASTLAKRFAAKEAFLKALGTGYINGIRWQDVEVANDEKGRPFLNITGKALLQLQNLSANTKIHLSLSDEYPYAQAFVIIEAIYS